MKKKQKKSATADAAADTTTTTADDLKSQITSHRVFFDKLIDLIPPKFYLPTDDSDQKTTWVKGLSKAAKASLKQQSLQNLKLARRNRLDPDKKDQLSTVQLLKQSIENQKLTENIDDDTKGNAGNSHLPPIDLGDGDDRVVENPRNPKKNENPNVTYEELRLKLHRKIEMLRGNRVEGMENNNRRVHRSENGEKKPEGKKRKKEEEEGGNGDEEEVIEYGKVKIGDDEDGQVVKKKKRKVSKAKELERLKRLEEVKRENRTVAEKEAWKAALNRAMGVKVHDDPGKLKVSMKKEKRRKEKSSEKWKERVESQEKLKSERQKKRRDNIAGKVKEKKMRKIAKREKKLMRPGFEGRKDGYITQDKN